jgi:hypothetical protein
MVEQNACPLPLTDVHSVAAELVVGNMTLRLYNGADQDLIRNSIACLGGVSCAW